MTIGRLSLSCIANRIVVGMVVAITPNWVVADERSKTLDVLKQADVKQIDYLINTHFCADHFGATAALAEQIPIRHFIDHGRSAEYQRNDDWWKAHRGPWFKPGMGKDKDALYETYLKAKEKGRHIEVKAGDTVPVKDLDVRVLCANGKVLSEPLPGAGQPNPAGEAV